MKIRMTDIPKPDFIFLDPVKLDTISSGNKQTKIEILRAFVASIPMVLISLEESIGEADPKATAQQLHKLKSSVSWMSVDKLIGYVQNAEEAVWRVAHGDYRDQLDLLVSATRMLTEEVTAFLATAH